MTYLLDTHTLLWAINDPKKLSRGVEKIIQTEENVCVSIISLWEIAIKTSSGKLDLKGKTFKDFLGVIGDYGFDPVPVDFADLSALAARRTMASGDPFDQLLAVQAMERGFALLSKDSRFEPYEKLGLKLVW